MEEMECSHSRLSSREVISRRCTFTTLQCGSHRSSRESTRSSKKLLKLPQLQQHQLLLHQHLHHRLSPRHCASRNAKTMMYRHWKYSQSNPSSYLSSSRLRSAQAYSSSPLSRVIAAINSSLASRTRSRIRSA